MSHRRSLWLQERGTHPVQGLLFLVIYSAPCSVYLHHLGEKWGPSGSDFCKAGSEWGPGLGRSLGSPVLCFSCRPALHCDQDGHFIPSAFPPKHRGLLSFHREVEGVLEARTCSRIWAVPHGCMWTYDCSEKAFSSVCQKIIQMK